VTGHDAESTSVLDALKDEFREVHMSAPVEQIVDAGKTRQRRHRFVKVTAVAATAAVLAFGVAGYNHPATNRTTNTSTEATSPLHMRTVAFVLDSQPDGSVKVTWTKRAYFQDSAGLQDALRKAGFPVLIKVGEFCMGPNDDGYLDPSGQGRGVDRVMRPGEDNGNVVFTFLPSAMPTATQLFIGFLSPAQLAITHGLPGSVERLVPTKIPLACTTQAPPGHQ
jgi:hypothetical protein